MQALGLIRPHFGTNRRRQRGHDARLQFAHAPMDFFEVFGREELLRRFIGQLQDMKTLWLGGKIMRAESEEGQLLILLGRVTECEPSAAYPPEADVAAASRENLTQIFLRQRHDE